MNQKYIRPYEGDSYSIEEGSELILELDARTKSSKAGLNSVNELAVQVEALLNTGKYVGYYTSLSQLQAAQPSPRNGDSALVGQQSTGIYEYRALAGEWIAESSLQLIDALTERVQYIENTIAPVPDWAQAAIQKLDF